MAKDKSAEDVRLAEIQAEVEKTRLRTKTFWFCFLASCITATAISGFYFVAKALDKPGWVTVVLAILTTNSAQSLVTWRVWARLRSQVDRDMAAGRRPPGLP